MNDLARTQNRSGLWRFYPNVNTRIITPFLLAIVTVAAIGVYIVTQLVAGSIQERFSNQLFASAESAANSITEVEGQRIATLRSMTFTEGVPEAIITEDAANLDLWLRSIAANNLTDELIVTGADASVILHLNRLDTPLQVEYATITDSPEVGSWQSVQRTLNGETDENGDKFVELQPGPTDEPTLYFNAPVTLDIEGENRVVGSIITGLRVNNLLRLVTQQSLSSVTINTPDGSVLGSTLPRDLSVLRLSEAAYDRLLNATGDNSPIEQITVDETPYQNLYAPFRVRGETLGLLSVGLQTNYIVEQSGISRNIFGAIFAGVFVVVLLMGIAVSRTITGPIRRLVSTTRAIREGDLSRRVELASRDELGELGLSFDTMTDTLVQRNQEVTHLLDQQVQATAQREAMLTSISDAVIVQDNTGQTILRNRTADHLLANIAENPTERATMQSLIVRPEALNAPQTVSFGEDHFSVLATPVQMANGDLLGYVVVFRDITALIAAERLKDELMLQMSHELRTPLSSVRGYVDLLTMTEGDNLSEQAIGFIDNARESLDALERLTNQVVDVSAMISNRFTIDIETFNLAYLLGDVFNAWQPRMKNRDLNFSLVLSNHDMYIDGDAERLAELFDHLLRNAHDYTLPGGMVEIQAEMTADRALVSVVDSGAGIAPDEQDKVFERLYRGRAADAGDTDARGMGLGLYIARQIIDTHHGTVLIESEPGLGTIITVGLPVSHRSEDERT
jgi:two-component system, OmpR family, sensor histidine kinase VicK